MTRTLLFAAVVAPLWAGIAQAKEPARGSVYRSAHFSIRLPPGWRVVLSREEPESMVDGGSPGAVAMEARAAGGRYLRIWFGCPATEGSADAMWHLSPDDNGRGVKSISENKWPPCAVAAMKACVQAAGEEAEERCPSCSGGDGRFDAWAIFLGKSPFGAALACVEIGNTATEDVDEAELRAILATLRIEGPTGLPGPGDAGWVEEGKSSQAAGLLPGAMAAAGLVAPSARWRTTYAQVGDFTFDGKMDVVLLGVDDEEAVVVVVEGPVTARSRAFVLRVPSDAGRQDAMCLPVAEAHLRTERPSLEDVCLADGHGECGALAKRVKRAAASGGLGLRLDVGDCDSFHIYFDGNGLSWWHR